MSNKEGFWEVQQGPCYGDDFDSDEIRMRKSFSLENIPPEENIRNAQILEKLSKVLLVYMPYINYVNYINYTNYIFLFIDSKSNV